MLLIACPSEVLLLRAKYLLIRAAGTLSGSCVPLPPSPPAEKGTARQDEAGQASTSDGAGTHPAVLMSKYLARSNKTSLGQAIKSINEAARCKRPRPAAVPDGPGTCHNATVEAARRDRVINCSLPTWFQLQQHTAEGWRLPTHCGIGRGARRGGGAARGSERAPAAFLVVGIVKGRVQSDIRALGSCFALRPTSR